MGPMSEQERREFLAGPPVAVLSILFKIRPDRWLSFDFASGAG